MHWMATGLPMYIGYRQKNTAQNVYAGGDKQELKMNQKMKRTQI